MRFRAGSAEDIAALEEAVVSSIQEEGFGQKSIGFDLLVRN
jgi:hypothetical protein